MHIEVDEQKCVASGQCVVSAPRVFDQRDSDGLVVLLDPSPTGTDLDQATEAEKLCPALAIKITAS